MRIAAVTAAVGAATLLGACGESGTSDDGRLQVVATTTHAADLTRHVAGDRAHVTQLLGPGADPHEYEPRPSDARALTDAKVVISSGGDVDEWLGDLVEQSGGGAEPVPLLGAVEQEGDDPHWWQDARNAQLAVGLIRDALTEADPGGSAIYRRNARAYQERLMRLDAEIADLRRGGNDPRAAVVGGRIRAAGNGQ